jgi:hypothetical protein
MRRGFWLLALPAPSFAISDGLSAILPELAVGGAQIAGMMMLFHAAITGVKLLHVNFMSNQELTEGPSIDNFTKFTPVTTADEWSEMSTHLDYQLDGNSGESVSQLNNDLDSNDPGLNFDQFDIIDDFDSGSGPEWQK